MWTRKDIKEFKDSIRKEGGDAIIKVGHGETVTVSFIFHNCVELFAQWFINLTFDLSDVTEFFFFPKWAFKNIGSSYSSEHLVYPVS